MPDIASIIISVIIVALLVAAMYWFFLKPSGEEVSTNITTIQKSIATLSESLSSQDLNITDIKTKVIPGIQTTINESIDKLSEKLTSLSTNTDSKNAELNKLIQDLKLANEQLGKTTSDSSESLKLLIGTLRKNFDDFAKTQGDVMSNLTQTQKAEIVKVYQTIESGLKSKDVSIETVQRSIEKSIEILNKTFTDKNTELATLISNLKKASDVFSDTTTKSVTALQGQVNNLQLAFNNFVKSQGDEIKRLDAKDQSNFDILNKKITDFMASEASDTAQLKKLISDSVAQEKADLQKKMTGFMASEASDTAELKKLISDLVAQEKADFETLSKKFPEITSTITEMKNNSQTMIDNVQKRIEKNDATDSTYNAYVDTINSYIDNALAIPEISDRVKKRIFTKKADRVIEFLTKVATNTREGSKGPERFSEVFIRDINEQLKTLIERKTGRILPVIDPSVLRMSLMYIAKTFPETDEDANDIITMIEFISSPEPTYNIATNTISGPVLDMINMLSAKTSIIVALDKNGISYNEFRKFAVKFRRAFFDKTMHKKLDITDDNARLNGDLNRLFPEDYAMEMFNLPDDKRLSYAIDKYNTITGCQYSGTSFPQPDKILAMLKKDLKNKELYELLWLSVFHHFVVEYGRKSKMIYDRGFIQRAYFSTDDEMVKKQMRESDSKQTNIFNMYLNSIGFPPITKDGENDIYSYSNAKKAFIQFFQTSLSNCNVFVDIFKGTLAAEDVCAFSNRKYEDVCPVNMTPVAVKTAAPVTIAATVAVAVTPAVVKTPSGLPSFISLEDINRKIQQDMANIQQKAVAASAALSNATPVASTIRVA